MYDDIKDAGSFCVTNCGSPRAQMVANFGPQVISHLFIKQCIDTGMDLQPTDETGHVVQKQPQEQSSSSTATATTDKSKNSSSTSNEATNTNTHNVEYTEEGKKYSAATTLASSAAATNMKLTKEEQMAEMKRLSEEQKEAADKETNSLFGRAQSFFKSGQINADGFKRF